MRAIGAGPASAAPTAVRWLLAAAFLAGCTGSSAPSAAGTPADLPRFELSVERALTYFEEFRMACAGPEDPFHDTREWRCVQEEASVTNTVRVLGDSAGVSQIVGISEGADPEAAISFLLGVVVGAVIADTDEGGMAPSLVEAPERGGRWHLALATVVLQPHSDARAVFVNPRGMGEQAHRQERVARPEGFEPPTC